MKSLLHKTMHVCMWEDIQVHTHVNSSNSGRDLWPKKIHKYCFKKCFHFCQICQISTKSGSVIKSWKKSRMGNLICRILGKWKQILQHNKLSKRIPIEWTHSPFCGRGGTRITQIGEENRIGGNANQERKACTGLGSNDLFPRCMLFKRWVLDAACVGCTSAPIFT